MLWITIIGWVGLLILASLLVYLLRRGGGWKALCNVGKKNLQLREALQAMQEERDGLKKLANNYFQLLQALEQGVPDFTKISSFSGKVMALQDYWMGLYKGEFFFVEMDESGKDKTGASQLFRELHKRLAAWNEMELMKRKVTSPFFETLNSQILEEQEVRMLVVKLAMQLYDEVSAFKSPNARLQEQGLNQRVVRGEIEEQKAWNLAKVVTNLEVETPLWARNLAHGLQGCGLEKAPLILSGYRLSDSEAANILPEESSLVSFDEQVGITEEVSSKVANKVD